MSGSVRSTSPVKTHHLYRVFLHESGNPPSLVAGFALRSCEVLLSAERFEGNSVFTQALNNVDALLIGVAPCFLLHRTL